jgi:uncharacterized protein YndB with AHSA1/START domain
MPSTNTLQKRKDNVLIEYPNSDLLSVLNLEYVILKLYNMKPEPIILQKTLHAPIARVWKAITDKEEMKKWYFDIKEFKPEAGFEFQFYAGEEGKPYLHLCKVTKVIAGRKISYSWRYDGYAGISHVTFELTEEGDHTRLRLTHRDLETFPIENPDLAKENFVAGWKELISISLKEYLEK